MLKCPTVPIRLDRPIYESSNLNVLIWWKCMVSYCRYHNGRTFIISCWRAWKVYANYICYILGRSLSCLIFCNYDSPQNWTWRMWSYILSVNIVLSIPQNYIMVGRRVTWKHGANCMAIYCMPYIWKCDKDSLANWVLNIFSPVFCHNFPHSIHSACNY